MDLDNLDTIAQMNRETTGNPKEPVEPLINTDMTSTTQQVFNWSSIATAAT